MENQNLQPQVQSSVQEKRLPQWLTTVTTFSKIFAMILFIALPFMGFYLGMKYQQLTAVSPTVIEIQKPATPTPTPTCMQRPACLDATPRCMIPEPANGWCPNQEQTCNTDSDCQNGATCVASGPLTANQVLKKICLPKGQATPL